MIKWKCPACDSEKLPVYLEVVDEYREYPISEVDGVYRRSSICNVYSSDAAEHPRKTYIKCKECSEMFEYDFILFVDEEVEMEEILDTGE